MSSKSIAIAQARKSIAQAKESRALSDRSALYAQCWLRRGASRQLAWLPEEFAVVGKYVRLTTAGDTENGWRVTSVGSRLTADFVEWEMER